MMTAATPSSPFIDTRELAAWIQIPDETLRSWRKRGEGPPWIKVGHLVRYEVEAVRAWLVANTRATSEP